MGIPREERQQNRYNGRRPALSRYAAKVAKQTTFVAVPSENTEQQGASIEAAVLPKRERPATQPSLAKHKSERVTVTPAHFDIPGIVLWFSMSKRFGFIKCNGFEKDIFLPYSVLVKIGLSEGISPDRPVHITFGPGPKGLVVTDLKV